MARRGTFQFDHSEDFDKNMFVDDRNEFMFTKGYRLRELNKENLDRNKVAYFLIDQLKKSCTKEIELYDLFYNESIGSIFNYKEKYNQYREERRKSTLWLTYAPLLLASVFLFATKKFTFADTLSKFGVPLIVGGVGLSVSAHLFTSSKPEHDEELISDSISRLHTIQITSGKLL